MLTMRGYEYIRYAYFHLGKSIREISRDSKKSRATIRKAIKGGEPKYRLTKSKPRPVMGDYEEIIRGWVLKDQQVPKKQRHTATRMYDRLVTEYGFSGSYSSVKTFVRKVKESIGLSLKQVFIASQPEKRNGCEVDWGEAHIDIDGSRTKVYMFCMRSKYSGKIFVRLYERMSQECFIDGHIRAFTYFGGVFKTVVYDNLRSAVKKMLQGRTRVEQESFLKFRAHYSYKAEFCNAASGWEKGGVEGLVGYARRNYLTPIPQCESLKNLNDRLLENCLSRDRDKTHGQMKSIGELFLEEVSELQKIPSGSYENYKLVSNKVNKYSMVQLDKNFYSVPENYVDKTVVVELGVNDVRITYSNRLIAQHLRCFGKEEWIINPWHYLSTLSKKPRAFESSRVKTAMDKRWPKTLQDLYSAQKSKFGIEGGAREFLKTLLLFKDIRESDMIAVIELAIENRAYSKESIEMLFCMLTEQTFIAEHADVGHISAIADFTVNEPDISKFDILIGE